MGSRASLRAGVIRGSTCLWWRRPWRMCGAGTRAIPLSSSRDAFALPRGITYLDGNSLGPLPHAARARLAQVVSEEWGAGPDPQLG